MPAATVEEYYRFAGRLIALSLRDDLPLCAVLAPPLCRQLMIGRDGAGTARQQRRRRQPYSAAAGGSSSGDDAEAGDTRRHEEEQQAAASIGGDGPAAPAAAAIATGPTSSSAEVDQPTTEQFGDVLETSDVRFISLATWRSCVDAELSPCARAQNIKYGGLTFGTESRELQVHLAANSPESRIPVPNRIRSPVSERRYHTPPAVPLARFPYCWCQLCIMAPSKVV